MGDAGSPYSRFVRALNTNNLMLIRAAAAELDVVRLDHALRVLVLIRDREPESFQRAADRWLARYRSECPEANPTNVEPTRSALAQMRTDPVGALEVLRAVDAPGAREAVQSRIKRRHKAPG